MLGNWKSFLNDSLLLLKLQESFKIVHTRLQFYIPCIVDFTVSLIYFDAIDCVLDVSHSAFCLPWVKFQGALILTLTLNLLCICKFLCKFTKDY